MFYVRTIHPAELRVEVAGFDLSPQLDQGKTVCDLFSRFLADHPAEFRERLPFLNRSTIELQWAAASGGAAFASFIDHDDVLTLGVLLTGVNEEADSLMLEALTENIAGPILGPQTASLLEAPERPLLLQLQMPDNPEQAPTIQLLSTALASVYFRAILALDAEEKAAIAAAEAGN